MDHRWLAVKLLEGVGAPLSGLKDREGGPELVREAEAGRRRLASSAPQGIEVALADRRYEFIGQIIGEVLRKPESAPPTLSERIDRVLTHRWLGLPLFLMVMYLVFNFVVNVSAPYLDWVDDVMGGPVTRAMAFALASVSAPSWLESLFLEGIIAGVGGILVFIPGLITLYLFIGLLEDSGYMSRAALVMDRFMGLLGLHGKSFVPMILGFGCAVPAIYATRTIDGRRDRILTGLLVPLMSCSARLPVYVVFALAFFGQRADLVIWGLYALGIAVAVLAGSAFSYLLFGRESGSDFVLELPPYRMPTLRSLGIQVRRRTGQFVRDAGTIILLASMVIWLLLSLPLGTPDLHSSLFGRVSDLLAPAFAPAGFDRWEAAGSLMSGLIAKEIIITTMAQIYVGDPTEAPVESFDLPREAAEIGVGFVAATVEAAKEMAEVLTPGVRLFDEGGEETSLELSAALRQEFTPLAALSFLVFVLLYVPCVATLGAIRGEFGWKWAVFSAAYQTSVAWLIAVLVYQGGRLLEFA